MSFHIHCLDWLLVFASAHPVGLFSSFSHFLKRLKLRNLALANMYLLLASMVGVILSLWLLKPGLLQSFRSISPAQIAVTVPLAIGCLVAEHFINVVFNFVGSRKWVFKPNVHSDWSQNIGLQMTLLLMGVVLAEEIIFRGFLLKHLMISFSLSAFFSVLISSVFYALHHLHFGWTSVFNKFISGLVYGASFLFFGTLWAPILIHGIQNLLILGLGKISNDSN